MLIDIIYKYVDTKKYWSLLHWAGHWIELVEAIIKIICFEKFYPL